MDPSGLDASKPSLLQVLFPAHTAHFSKKPIGGSVASQLQYADATSLHRDIAFNLAMLSPNPIDLATGELIGKVGAFGSKFVTGWSVRKGTEFGYHATTEAAAKLILENGFRAGQAQGRLGSGGVYINNTVRGAIAEFSYHNPGITPTVLRVSYQPGVRATASIAPRKYAYSHPLNVDSLTAPSVRAPGTINTNVINGTTIPLGIIK